MPIDKPLRLIVDEIGDDVDKLTNKVVLTIHRSWVLGCPVREGRARGSINVSVGRVNNQLVNSPDKSGGSTMGQAIAKLSQAKGRKVVHIQSAIPYMQGLEDGKSKQNKGFIKQAFLNGQLVAQNG